MHVNVSEPLLYEVATRHSFRLNATLPEEGERFRQLGGYFEDGHYDGLKDTGKLWRSHSASSEAQVQARVGGSPITGDTVFMAVGQAFTLMTAVKDQLSTWPSDVELTQAVDTNYLAGTVWLAPSPIPPDVVSVAAIQLGRVGRESRTADRERADTTTWLLQQRHRGAAQLPGP